METIQIELIGVIVTLIAGFGGIFYRLGRREQHMEDIATSARDNQARLEAHEEKCDERNAKIDTRLAEGSTDMALVKQTSEGNSKKLENIERMLLDQFKGKKT